MAIRIRDLAIYESLSVVTIDGFEPEKQTEEIDPVGTANWLVSECGYGMAPDDFEDAQAPGILWTDYDGPGWTFDVLIASDEVGDFREIAQAVGYSIEKVREVSEPQNFGDGNGTVEILKHRDGWVIIRG